MSVGSSDGSAPRVSVLMPTFAQAAFIGRALDSLGAQTLGDWELVVVDDGSPDDTRAALAPYLADPRVRYERLADNRGLGAALNRALALARAPLVAYLPSDDVYYPDHLAALVALLAADPATALAYAGVKNEYRVPGKGVLRDGTSTGQIPDYPLQLVQVAHRRTDDRWVEREELVTDDLDRMYWARLRARGAFVGTGRISCEWVDHPRQRHKIIREPLGGLNPYRSYYGVKAPLRFHSTQGNEIDEVAHYRRFRERPDTPRAADGLTIVLVGELAFNPERVLALEERGHALYGLWTPDGHWFNTVGPLPFGHVAELPRGDWRGAVRRLKPDLFYGLLNWQAVPFAHHVLTENPGVPFVWHLKEGPFFCLEKGTWPQLVDLHTRSDGQVYSSPEMRDWFATALPGGLDRARTLVLDGDLPKREWFAGERQPLLSATDGELHTVVPGGPIGHNPALMARLAAHDIHLHFYGDFHQGQWLPWIEEMRQAAPQHFHRHPHVHQDRWVSELSRYDAGWLHLLRSENGGDLRRANWGDLNYPARIPTLVSAGVPLLQYDNGDAVVAQQSLARRLDLGLSFNEVTQLAEQLRDGARMARLRDSVWHQREQFTFDYHADRLLAFFRRAIARRSGAVG